MYFVLFTVLNQDQDDMSQSYDKDVVNINFTHEIQLHFIDPTLYIYF